MARTVSEIYNQIITEKETFDTLSGLTPINTTYQNLLNDLTGSVKVAVWRLWVFVISLAIWWHEQIFDAHLQEVDDRIREGQIGQLRWYRQKVLGFQNGYDLVWQDDQYQYTEVDNDARIVEQASASEGGTAILIKVAKDDGAGGLTVLSSAEENALNAYLSQIKPAGVSLEVYNLAADDMKLTINFMYDPEVLNQNGELLKDSNISDLNKDDKPGEIAVQNYIQNLPFDSTFRVTDLIKAITDAEGITNAVVTQCEARQGTDDYDNILAKYAQNYKAKSGRLQLTSSTYNYYEHI
jgi:hypothetical protein